jgi:hypothetical protein
MDAGTALSAAALAVDRRDAEAAVNVDAMLGRLIVHCTGNSGYHAAALKNPHVEYAAGVDQSFRSTVQVGIEHLLQLETVGSRGIACCVIVV